MKFYLAPMEGITGYIYRNVYHAFFDHIDKYFSPFIASNQNHKLKTRELKDILPQNNEGLHLVPQILTNHAKDFISTSKILKEYGYTEINLNLGCPSATVVTKGKGSGFLAYPDKLNEFLDEIFDASVTEISIKTRIGKESPDEFDQLLDIYNTYPIKELIIHPRIQTDMYRNKVNGKVFEKALSASKNKVIYNGDLFTLDDITRVTNQNLNLDTVMIGRGILANPQLLSQFLYGESMDKRKVQAFIHQLAADYSKELSGDRDVLFRLKELWFYMIVMFTNYEPYQKKMRKADRLSEYLRVIDRLFDEQEMIPGAGFHM